MKWMFDRAGLGVLAGSLGLCFFIMGTAVPAAAAPAPTAEAATPGATRFAVVWRLRGDVSATRGSAQRKLREGDPVYVGERVQAASQAEAVLRTEDAGVVAVRPGTAFVAERYAAEDKPTDSLSIRLLTGSLRVISGWISRTNRNGHNIVTASATIGIRGTDHEPYVLSPELAKETNNPEGTYDKVNRGGTTMKVGDNTLDIDPGKVGFVRAPARSASARCSPSASSMPNSIAIRRRRTRKARSSSNRSASRPPQPPNSARRPTSPRPGWLRSTAPSPRATRRPSSPCSPRMSRCAPTSRKRAAS
jgi:hypothetical protein